jgi:hypothetical protein
MAMLARLALGPASLALSIQAEGTVSLLAMLAILASGAALLALLMEA